MHFPLLNSLEKNGYTEKKTTSTPPTPAVTPLFFNTRRGITQTVMIRPFEEEARNSAQHAVGVEEGCEKARVEGETFEGKPGTGTEDEDEDEDGHKDEDEGEKEKEKESHHIKATESMVTVRLSDAEAELPSMPSPTPTVRLVDEKSEEYILADDGPLFVPERSESPDPSELTASRRSTGERSSGGRENAVDWAGLEKTEGEQTKDMDQSAEEVRPATAAAAAAAAPPSISVSQANDSNAFQGTAFLLARLEQENKRLEKDPKAMHIHPERPPSLAKLRQMMDNPDPNTLRYSMLPAPPPLTDLDFYAALVADYNRAASKLPYLLSKKIRGGIPPPLRGVVWIAMSGARDCNLEVLYDQLLGETSPYEQLIGKDVGRTGLEMFSQEGGEGQHMLGRVLRAFSIYDTQIGYCQGFVSTTRPPAASLLF